MKSALCLLLFVVVVLLINCHCDDDMKINVELYYESLCPGCQDFILHQLAPTMSVEGIDSIIHLRLIPYGNARELSPLNFTCQHGPMECEGNVIEQCMIYYNGNSSLSAFPQILCMEKLLEKGEKPFDALDKCVADSDKIRKCALSSLGASLMHQNAVETKNLSPPHEYVPWIVVDHVHDEQMQDSISDDMLAFVCKYYKGPKSNLPKECFH